MKREGRRGNYLTMLAVILAFALGVEAQRRGYPNIVRQNPGDIYRLLIQHLQLVFISGSIAVALGLTIGIVLTRGFIRRYREMTLNMLGVCQTVPSLAVIAIAITYLGIGRKTAIFVLVFYSLLPIIRNTVAGIFQVDPALVDAGHGMGMTPQQVLFRVPGFLADEAETQRQARELLDLLGLSAWGDTIASELPYGQQRRREIARALAGRPKLLLLDEPAAGLNPQESDDLMHLIEEIRRRFRLTILLIEHDMRVVMGICRRIAVLDYGIKISEGSPAEIRHDPKVIEADLGEEVEADLGGGA